MFIAMLPCEGAGVYDVPPYPMKKELQPLERNSDDSKLATAESLISIATKAFMQMHDVDYETAQRWITGALDAK